MFKPSAADIAGSRLRVLPTDDPRADPLIPMAGAFLTRYDAVS